MIQDFRTCHPRNRMYRVCRIHYRPSILIKAFHKKKSSHFNSRPVLNIVPISTFFRILIDELWSGHRICLSPMLPGQCAVFTRFGYSPNPVNEIVFHRIRPWTLPRYLSHSGYLLAFITYAIPCIFLLCHYAQLRCRIVFRTKRKKFGKA